MSSERPLTSIKFGDALDAIIDHRGKTPKKMGGDWVASGYRVISALNIKNRRVDDNDHHYVDRDLYLRWMKNTLEAGDVLMTSEAPLGETAYLAHKEEWCLGQRIFGLRGKAGILNGRYLFYLLQDESIRSQIFGRASGTTVVGIRQKELVQIQLNIPTIDVQKKISGLLGSLDDRIALLRETNATLEAIAQAMFKSWFVDFEPVHAKQQGRAPEGMSEATAALFPDSFKESGLGLVPRGWKVGTLANLATLNPESWTAKNHPDTLAYIDLANAKDNEIAEVSEYLFDEAPSRARRVLRDGDTIVGTVRPGNRSFAFIHEPSENLTASTGFAVLRPTQNANTEFVYLAATQDASIEHLSHLADGAAYPAVRPNVVAGIQCVLPSADIMQIFHDVTAPLLSKVSDNKQQAQTLATLRDTLLPRLISGQLRIADIEGATP